MLPFENLRALILSNRRLINYGSGLTKETVSMDYRTKVLASLISLALVDTVIPVPVIGLILVYVIFAKPSWFSDLVAKIYGRAEGGG